MTCRTDEMSHSTPRNLLDVMEASPPEIGIEMAPKPGPHERAPQQITPWSHFPLNPPRAH